LGRTARFSNQDCGAAGPGRVKRVVGVETARVEIGDKTRRVRDDLSIRLEYFIFERNCGWITAS
jgi:hypothetical protein